MDKTKVKIALDAMGGDFAPTNEILGAIEAFKNKGEFDLKVYFVGNQNLIKSFLNTQTGLSPNFDYEIIDADEVVTMDDEPASVIKTKKNSSLYKGIELLKNREVDAFVSSGNTGATMSVSTVLLGRVKGVTRPTIGSFFPTKTDKTVFLLDVGANVESKPRYLYEFAIMGGIYAGYMMGIKNPKIGLLNIGEEETKGTEDVREAYKLLRSGNINFVGNIEGRDVFSNAADVIVCDGFIGNIILKFAESFIGVLTSKIRAYADKNVLNKIAIGMMKPLLRRVLKQFDYQHYGGVPLLGVNGVVIIGHGKSTPLAVSNMILRAAEMVRININQIIENSLVNI